MEHHRIKNSHPPLEQDAVSMEEKVAMGVRCSEEEESDEESLVDGEVSEESDGVEAGSETSFSGDDDR